MKQITFIITIILSLCFADVSFADTLPAIASSNTPNAVVQSLSEDDLNKLRVAVDILSKNMDAAVDKSVNTNSTDKKDEKPKTTVADVANKALDMMAQELLLFLII